MHICIVYIYIHIYCDGMITMTEAEHNNKLCVLLRELSYEYIYICVNLTIFHAINQSWLFWTWLRRFTQSISERCATRKSIISRLNKIRECDRGVWLYKSYIVRWVRWIGCEWFKYDKPLSDCCRGVPGGSSNRERPEPCRWTRQWTGKDSTDGLANVATLSLHHGLCYVPERLY